MQRCRFDVFCGTWLVEGKSWVPKRPQPQPHLCPAIQDNRYETRVLICLDSGVLSFSFIFSDFLNALLEKTPFVRMDGRLSLSRCTAQLLLRVTTSALGTGLGEDSEALGMLEG